MSIKKLLANKLFISLAVLLFIIIIIALCCFMPDIIGQYIKRYGVELSPNVTIEPLTDVVYLQTDDRWKNEYLAETDYTLASQGCLTCVIAMDLCYLGYDVIPTDVNNDFVDNSAYTKNGQLIWRKINSAYDDIEYDYKKTFNSKTINKGLQNGLLPIVKVKYKKTGIFHWVLIVGADENNFLILDPLDNSMEPIPLSTHGKVYAYRVLKKVD